MQGAGVGQRLYLPGRFGARVTYRLCGGWTFSSSFHALLSQDPDTESLTGQRPIQPLLQLHEPR